MEILQPVWSPVLGFDPLHCEKFSSYIKSLILCLCTSEKCLAPASLHPPVRQCQTAIRPSFCLLPAKQIAPPQPLLVHLVCLLLTRFVASSGLTPLKQCLSFTGPSIPDAVSAKRGEGNPLLSANLSRVHSVLLPMSLIKTLNSMCTKISLIWKSVPSPQ